MACGCGGTRNQAQATPEQLVAAAQQRAEQQQALDAQASQSQASAVTNANSSTR